VKFDVYRNVYKLPFAPLRATAAARASIAALYPEPFVTVSIRDSDVQVERNSNQAEWAKVCHYLQMMGYRVVVVPDTEALLQGKPCPVWHDLCPVAAINVDLRMALYELSQFSLFTSGGPFNLGVWDELVNYAVFKLRCDGIRGCKEELLTLIGLEDGSNRGEHREHWWGEDTAEFVISKIEPYLRIQKSVDPSTEMDAQTHYMGHKLAV